MNSLDFHDIHSWNCPLFMSKPQYCGDRNDSVYSHVSIEQKINIFAKAYQFWYNLTMTLFNPFNEFVGDFGHENPALIGFHLTIFMRIVSQTKCKKRTARTAYQRNHFRMDGAEIILIYWMETSDSI